MTHLIQLSRDASEMQGWGSMWHISYINAIRPGVWYVSEYQMPWQGGITVRGALNALLLTVCGSVWLDIL